ncbi:hypothetical protein J2X65_003504 [Ancylobacter sp. 3268]|uniref:hypothetical protein n=1 Tax=Ancylobacter sp. 3268 TaxID=2817752 RepID=UPI00285FDAAA|nr:hypothetical protein [Ancylobacter sp. 3268]MDR6954136.1 hypothetical protein [Ancylobacter sp. 3268]
MRIVKSGKDLQLIGRFAGMAEILASERARTELHRGVVDAGRKIKTRVQKAVAHQMALRSGNYQSYVVAGTRGIPRRELLAFDIFGVKGGTDIEEYRGLRAVARSNRMNLGRRGIERGTVRSSVWNNPRVFKRSFATDSGFYAFRPPEAGTTSQAPKILWTYGLKENQPRGANGRFASTNVQYGKVRRLFGPSLMKEIPEDESLEIFMREGPVFLLQSVEKRLTKLMRF